MANILKVEGIGPNYKQKLNQIGIRSTKTLLRKGATPAGRKEIAKKSGISDALILKWVNHADLFRIKGVAEEYSDLLEAAGVDTVVELAQRNSDNLIQAIEKTNKAKKLVRQLPTEKQVADWIRQAKKLPRAIQY
jgi:predicted flap endonuclease-1-like 5' DNA nuclease